MLLGGAGGGKCGPSPPTTCLFLIVRSTNVFGFNFLMQAPYILRCFDFWLEGAEQERMGLRRPTPPAATGRGLWLSPQVNI